MAVPHQHEVRGSVRQRRDGEVTSGDPGRGGGGGDETVDGCLEGLIKTRRRSVLKSESDADTENCREISREFWRAGESQLIDDTGIRRGCFTELPQRFPLVGGINPRDEGE